VSRGEVCDGLPVEAGRVAQRVEARNRVVTTTHQPAKVERGALGRGDIHARHRLVFFGQQPVPASDYPRGARAFVQMTSTGASSGIHRAQCIAEAAEPAITPCLRVHSHAAAVRCAGVGVAPIGK